MPIATHNDVDGSRSNGHYADKIEEPTSYLITGANRGIGRGLVAEFLLRPGSTVVACVRDPAHATSSSLQELPKADACSLIVLKLDCKSPSDAAHAVEELRDVHHIRSLDVVVANAAIAANFGPTSTMTTAALAEHMQSCASHKARFVFIGAPISTITEMEGCARAPLGAYGMSKLAANYIVRKLHFENKWLIAFIVDPGHVQTDMGDAGARLMGRKEAPTTLKQSVDGIIARIQEASKESSSGQFLLHEDGSKVAW